MCCRKDLETFRDALGNGAMSAYANFLGLSDSSVSKKVQLLNNTELSEKGALQMLFDQRLVHDFLAGGMKPSPEAPKLASEKARVITQSLIKGLDPIDWATYEPYLWENEARCYVRCSVLLGSFVQLYKLHKACPQLRARNEDAHVQHYLHCERNVTILLFTGQFTRFERRIWSRRREGRS